MVSKRLVIKWMLLGAVTIIVLQQVAILYVADPFAEALAPTVGPFLSSLIAGAVTTSVSFFVGGLLVGRMSPGETLREPGLACIVALATWACIDAWRNGAWADPISIFFYAALAYGIGMSGGWVGERWQDFSERRVLESERA